jgi:CRP/FNR family transcriptional regulator, cyclic AMP receptor protein
MSIAGLLQATPALSGAAADDVAEMARTARVRSLTRGAALWRAGDAPFGLCIVQRGLIKVVRVSANGDPMICGLFGPRTTIGELALLRSIPYPADAIVATPQAEIIVVERGLVERHAKSRPEFALSLVRCIHEKVATLHDKIDILSAGSVEARLATALLKLHAEYGDEQEDGSAHIPVVLSRKELASLVSTSLETSIRTMSRWTRAGVLSTTTAGFLIHDLAALTLASQG